MNRIAIVYICFIFLVGCDIPGKIIFENKSRDMASYRCFFSNSDSVIHLQIQAGENKNKHSIFFGFGHKWTDNRIREYVSKIERIEISSISESIFLSDKTDMYNFFRMRRKGAFKDEIRIIIK